MTQQLYPRCSFRPAFLANIALATVAIVIGFITRSEADTPIATKKHPHGIAIPSKKAPDAAPPAPLPEAKGTKIDKETYAVVFAPVGECKRGSECTATIRLETKGEYHVNKEYPNTFTADTSGVVQVEFLPKDPNAKAKNVFSKNGGDFLVEPSEKVGVMHVRFKVNADSPTVAVINGKLKFGVCKPGSCALAAENVGLTVPVK